MPQGEPKAAAPGPRSPPTGIRGSRNSIDSGRSRSFLTEHAERLVAEGAERLSEVELIKPPPFVSLDSSGNPSCCARILYSFVWEVFIGVVLIFNFVIIIVDTDLRAKQGSSPAWLPISSDICMLIYLLELGCRLIVENVNIFHSNWNILDFIVVTSGIVEKAIEMQALEGQLSGGFTGFSMLRAVRILRLFRAMKLMSALKELRKLIQMMMLCVRTLFWSCLLAFLLMTIWGVLMVELMQPTVQRLEETNGIWEGDTDWTMAFSSVMRANLMLFQTVVAGDSWGKIPIPVIEAEPWTAFFFIPAHLTLVFGVLNLIVVVLVDEFAEQRSRDVKGRLAEKSLHEKQEKRGLHKLFDSIDTDGSGTLSVEELEAAGRESPELKAQLRVMDMREGDLQRLFAILDEDGSGDVDPDEFADIMYRLRYSDSQASITMLKHYVEDLAKRQEKFENSIDAVLSRVSQVLQGLRRMPNFSQGTRRTPRTNHHSVRHRESKSGHEAAGPRAVGLPSSGSERSNDSARLAASLDPETPGTVPILQPDTPRGTDFILLDQQLFFDTSREPVTPRPLPSCLPVTPVCSPRCRERVVSASWPHDTRVEGPTAQSPVPVLQKGSG